MPGNRGSSRRRLDRPERRPELMLIPGYDPYATAGDCTYFPELAAKALAFFRECLTHVKGSGLSWSAGGPLELEPWQACITSNLFGWLRPDGTRRYRKCLIYVPRKNGKSTFGAGIGLYVLTCDGEPGAENYSAASTKEQAALIFQQAKKMVESEPELAAVVQCYTNSLVYGSSSYQILSGDAHGKHGGNAHLLLIDELHEQKNRELIDTLLSSRGARRQPLTIFFTTADYARESICNEVYEHAKKVRDGVISDPSFLPVIYEASKDDDWESEETWRKANPNYGVSVQPQFLREEAEQAKNTPGYLNTFKRLYLNVQTDTDVAWLRLDLWDQAPPLDVAALAGQECYAGLDLSTTTDLSADVLVFPPSDERPFYALLPRFYAPRERARERQKRDGVPYVEWAQQGLLTLTEGDVIDYDRIFEDACELGRTYQIREIAYDPWNATATAQRLKAAGFETVEFRQGFFSFAAPCRELEKIVVGRQLAHGGNPVLRWMASNVHAEYDSNGNARPNKAKSTGRIDGIVATLMGIGRHLVRPREQPSKSIYETQGFRTL